SRRRRSPSNVPRIPRPLSAPRSIASSFLVATMVGSCSLGGCPERGQTPCRNNRGSASFPDSLLFLKLSINVPPLVPRGLVKDKDKNRNNRDHPKAEQQPHEENEPVLCHEIWHRARPVHNCGHGCSSTASGQQPAI